MKNIKQTTLHAGRFSAWLWKIRKAIAENRGMNVPCGTCNACCRSSYFIYIKPEETRTLRQIPKGLLFAAPLLPRGHMILGYDKYGRCPMLNEKCSIYKSRPETCRSFDCRILTAAGLATKVNNPIAQQAQRWEFSCPAKDDRNMFSAVQSAASFLTKHPFWLMTFIEIFDQARVVRQLGSDVTELKQGSKYRHLRFEVKGLETYREILIGKEVSVSAITVGLDNSKQAWIKDPDGDDIELMKYTPDIFQISKK